ncbi:ATP-dependent DNA ligase [Curtobacterium sp. RRHDQ10]|uniref:ATP-dependent DNA ligase n=1 Tax=Curtobacterium phyllosphaerae TaxID=3413379 RepID=UPI003BF146EA
MPTIQPMLAKAVQQVPAQDSVPGGYSYEPKWDGFRGIVTFTGDRSADDAVEIGSRGSKPLTRYFPELVAAFREQLPGPCVLDGEIVVRSGTPGAEKLDWEALSQRIHPAASRIERLSAATPAAFVAFDLLEFEDHDLTGLPFDQRREALLTLAESMSDPLFVSQTTLDDAEARQWLHDFEGAGLDGVVAKARTGLYLPNKRAMLKVKHHRTADVVAIGYRVHKSGTGVGSLLLGLYDDEADTAPSGGAASGAGTPSGMDSSADTGASPGTGASSDGDPAAGAGSVSGVGTASSPGASQPRQVGGVSAFSDQRRRELEEELAPLVLRDADGRPVVGEGERSRFSSGRDTTFVPLRPELVLEVRYDQMEGDRFRHTVQFERWRPDREARSCTFEQLEVPAAYDLSRVLR